MKAIHPRKKSLKVFLMLIDICAARDKKCKVKK